MPKHTIKVFVVFDSNANASLQYIRQSDDDLNDVGPGQPVKFVPGTKIRWKGPNNASMSIHFDSGSPFDSGDTDLSVAPPKAFTKWETIKHDVPTSSGGNPDYKYTVTVATIVDDPDIVIDITGGGGGAGRGKKNPPKHKPNPKHKK